jgi:hypothetical protein
MATSMHKAIEILFQKRVSRSCANVSFLIPDGHTCVGLRCWCCGGVKEGTNHDEDSKINMLLFNPFRLLVYVLPYALPLYARVRVRFA